MVAFSGFRAEALHFYEGLEADNSKAYWTEHRPVYEAACKAPMAALCEALGDFGPFKIFRPYNDVRFSAGKALYKTHIGAVTETEGGTLYYVQLGAQGLFVASGYHNMASDQIERYREAVAGDAGAELEEILTAAAKGRYQIGGEALKVAPRGYPRDHPRVRWLRHKGVTLGKAFPVARWLHTKAVVDRVRAAWNDAADLSKWMDHHVGPSTLPPDIPGRRTGS